MYSIDWPFGFKSQTCDPNSPHFVGKIVAQPPEEKGSRKLMKHDVLDFLKRSDKPLTAIKVAELMHVTRSSAASHLQSLVEDGLATRQKVGISVRSTVAYRAV